MAADDPIAMNEHLKRDGCDVVITDYWLGWSDGLSILHACASDGRGAA